MTTPLAHFSCDPASGRALPRRPSAAGGGSGIPEVVTDRIQEDEGERRDRTSMVRDQLERPRDGRTPIRNRQVLEAMAEVPRHLFVPAELRHAAYQDRPLPIGEGQTISQPYMVAIMSELLDLSPGDRVLEVGLGSGYQAAVLAALGAEVRAIEILEPLHRSATALLEGLGYPVRTRHGDGWAGWPEAAPFRGITVACAPDRVPPALVEQLAPDGSLVIPIGPRLGYQELKVISKSAAGRVTTRREMAVGFVPMTGDLQAPP